MTVWKNFYSLKNILYYTQNFGWLNLKSAHLFIKYFRNLEREKEKAGKKQKLGVLIINFELAFKAWTYFIYISFPLIPLENAYYIWWHIRHSFKKLFKKKKDSQILFAKLSDICLSKHHTQLELAPCLTLWYWDIKCKER